MLFSQGRILERLKRRAEETATRELEKEVDKAVREGMNPDEKSKKDKKKKNKDSEESQEEGGVDSEGTSEQSPEEKKEIEVWKNKYDFVSGSEILFYDDQKDEELGEFPSRWDLIKGSAENVKVDGENVIEFEGRIVPLFKDEFELPEKFTIEFDAYFGENKVCGSYHYQLIFLGANERETFTIIVSPGYAHVINIQEDKVPEKTTEDFLGTWQHLSFSFNKRSFKAYYDQFRLINIPNIKTPPASFMLYTCCCGDRQPFYIKNFKLAEGAKKLYDREFTDGRIVTHNILFEVDKATLLPRSYAEINRIAELLQENPDTRFRIEGHTDSDGEDDYNLELSQKRAEAVKIAMIELGVEEARLETKGLGESQPMMPNSSPEAKAQNRRVEFIKL